MIHLIFDILSYIVAGGVSVWLFKGPKVAVVDNKWDYYTYVVVGFAVGAIALSTLNNYLSLNHLVIGKSIMGALAGGIIAAEIYKKIHHLKGSTGAYFVPSLAIGIAIGRIGCFLSGIDDFTYGVETSLPWGVNFGDGVTRHPVQLYESVSMFGFFLYSVYELNRDRAVFERNIFYKFILFYAAQRFVWELLKPYSKVVAGIDIFGIVSIFMILYAAYYLRRT